MLISSFLFRFFPVVIESLDSVVSDSLSFFRTVFVMNNRQNSKSSTTFEVRIFYSKIDSLNGVHHLFHFRYFPKVSERDEWTKGDAAIVVIQFKFKVSAKIEKVIV